MDTKHTSKDSNTDNKTETSPDTVSDLKEGKPSLTSGARSSIRQGLQSDHQTTLQDQTKLGASQEAPTSDAVNATILHTAYEDAVRKAVEDPDQGIHVYNQDLVGTINGKSKAGKGLSDSKSDQVANGKGFIDTRIDQEVNGKTFTTIIDYKTHDMSQWSKSDAERYAKEFGEQMSKYQKSPDTPEVVKLFLIHTGKKPEDPSVLESYKDAAALHGFEVKFPIMKDTEVFEDHVQGLIQSVQEAMDETRSV